MDAYKPTSGSDTSFSHLLTAWAETFSFFANASCVQPFFLRNAVSLFPKDSFVFYSSFLPILSYELI